MTIKRYQYNIYFLILTGAASEIPVNIWAVFIFKGVFMYFLGIDAGGSKCRARLVDVTGHIVGNGRSGPANIRIGVANVFSVLQEAYHQAISEAKLDAAEIKSINAGIGIAGIGRIGALEEMRAQPFPFQCVRLCSDGLIANIGAHSGRDGGSVIIGTGSIAVGQVKGRNIHVGGYGFPASDEGSGAYMGLQAIRMTLRASDGRLSHSALTDDLFHKFGREVRSVIGWMDKASATDYAALAPLVMKAAEESDPVGSSIVRRAAHHIELMVQSLYASGIPRCALTGGLSERLMPWLSPDIRAKIFKADGDSLDGALALARQKASA